MRKFADKQTKNRQDGIQTLRPLYLYPLWILEGVGQFAYNQRTDRRFKN